MLKRARVQMMPHDGPVGAGLQVKQVLRVPSQTMTPETNSLLEVETNSA
jgi:hypothetical protein